MLCEEHLHPAAARPEPMGAFPNNNGNRFHLPLPRLVRSISVAPTPSASTFLCSSKASTGSHLLPQTLFAGVDDVVGVRLQLRQPEQSTCPYAPQGVGGRFELFLT